MTVTQLNKQLPYSLESLISCDPPFQTEGCNWFQYKISQGRNIITGYKCGDYAHVLESVEVNIDRLNQRQKGKFGNMNIPKSKS